MDTTYDDFATVKLLRFETVQLRSPAITAVTFYQGKPPLEYIQGKAEEIFAQNPWIQGRLSKVSGKLALRYPKTSRGIGQFVRVLGIPALRSDMGFSDLARVLKNVVVKTGSSCLNKEEDLFRIVVAQIADDKFALVVSMSHVYADGYTFYEVHKMLSSIEQVRPLIVERLHSSGKDVDAAMRGGDDSLPWLSSPGFVMNVLGTLLRGRASTSNLFAVDQRKIAEWKKEHETDNNGKFVSSNDIITSRFFAQTACDLIFMTVNFRDRVPEITRNHAGNYERLVAYQREDFAQPELIRSSLSDYRRAMSGKLPGFFKSIRTKLGAITNWATFYQDVVLPDCKLLFHRPVVDTALFVPFEHTVIVFKSQQEQLSVVTCCKNTFVLSKMEILKERIV